jgi:uncharacterized OB-fold protein
LFCYFDLAFCGIIIEVIYLEVYRISMAEITLKGYKCERCGHKWVPRERDFPRVCPKCKSPYWDKPRRLATRKQDIDPREKRRPR